VTRTGWPPILQDPRALCLGGAFLLLLAAAFSPKIETERKAYDILAVIDITGSMNARDYALDGRQVSRLEKVKRVLRDFLVELPCGSRLGLAVFTERRTFLLFEPVDVCRGFPPIDGAIAALDWRMAWEGDSRVTSGLYSAVGSARDVGADLIFLTDGQEAPPLPHTGPPPFEGRAGEVQGLVVGVGGKTLVPIPKFDSNGREIGFYAMTDVPQENRSGPPPPGAEQREGWHPRNAPFGGEAAVGDEHLTSVREDHLRTIAANVGLAYAPLSEAPELFNTFSQHARPRPLSVPTDMAPVPASAALILFLVIFAALPLFERYFASSTHNRRNLS
jgi:mxaL protein